MGFLRWLLWTLICDERGNIGKMITPPKSKSPWEAMTQGSTGGWARALEGWGPVFTTAAGAIPGVGPLFAAGMGMAGMAGGKTGFRGTDYGWGNVAPMLAGAGLGYLEGGLGRGISTGIGSMGKAGTQPILNKFVTGFGQGVKGYGLGSPGVQRMINPNAIPTAGGGVINQPLYGGAPAVTGTAATLAGATGGATALTAGGGAAGAAATGLTTAQKLGMGATALGAIGSLGAEAPTYDYATYQERMEDIKKNVLTKYLGDAAMDLPNVAAEEYMRQIKTPLGEAYPIELEAQWTRIEPVINKSYDDYEKSINAQFAQSGGIGSSDHRNALNEARQLRTAELSQARKEIEQNIFNTQVMMKQEALARAAQQGQFDMEIAKELAKLSGDEQALLMAFETQDYDAFQAVMSKIMSLGYQTTIPNVSMYR